MKYCVIDDAVAPIIQQDISDYYKMNEVEWHYNAVTVGGDEAILGALELVESCGLVHKEMPLMANKVYKHGKHVKPMPPFMHSVLSALPLRIDDILRIQVNQLFANSGYPENGTSMPHYDMKVDSNVFPSPLYSAIYYIEDSDGDTFLYEDGKILDRVSPKKGRICMFRGDMIHSSQNPRVHDRRLVINMVFTASERGKLLILQE